MSIVMVGKETTATTTVRLTIPIVPTTEGRSRERDEKKRYERQRVVKLGMKTRTEES